MRLKRVRRSRYSTFHIVTLDVPYSYANGAVGRFTTTRTGTRNKSPSRTK